MANAKFSTIATQLATADANTKVASADANAARAERSNIATNAILAAFKEGITVDDTRSALLDAGVLKGTVSKITTVVQALNDKTITEDDVKSLNGSYSAVVAAKKAAAAAILATKTTGVAVAGEVVGASTPVSETAKAISPDEALQVIIDFIKAQKNDAKRFKLGGEWLTKVTNRISAELKENEDED